MRGAKNGGRRISQGALFHKKGGFLLKEGSRLKLQKGYIFDETT